MFFRWIRPSTLCSSLRARSTLARGASTLSSCALSGSALLPSLSPRTLCLRRMPRVAPRRWCCSRALRPPQLCLSSMALSFKKGLSATMPSAVTRRTTRFSRS
eukprot:Amastigsp_a175050_30.p3 type:complete len:103 gc:universal Amastigsp_a175050_30:1061-753(-)